MNMFKYRVLIFLIIFIFIASFVNSDKDDRDSVDRHGEQTYRQKIQKQINSVFQHQEAEVEPETWTGRWLPARPNDPKPPPKVLHKTGVFKDHNIKAPHEPRLGMGVISRECDDGKTNLRIDWNWSPVNYTCYGDHVTPSYSIKPMIYCEHIPSSYVPIHKCMSETIEYDDVIPIYGSHRPVWPVYGEYKFLPKQRWIHSLEHGAIVMLYHPCANPLEVKRLKKILSGCMRRYIISPYTLLDEDRPLALLSWGCRLTMSYVNPTVARDFIKQKALRGPERIYKHGGFAEYIISPSQIVSDEKDSDLCPDM